MTTVEIRPYQKPYESLDRYMERDCPCDLCGGNRYVNKIEQYEDHIWLCPRCNEYVGFQPEGLAQIVRTFIIGNAL